MSKTARSFEELLETWKKTEEENRLKEERQREEAKRHLPEQCKNCFNSWYRLIPPTGSFTESTEYCGCRLKNILVDPNGICESFKL